MNVYCIQTTLLIYESSLDKMYFRILIGISILTFSSGASSNQAISSISFHRDDVPLSYKYSSIHIYSTEKPNSQTRPEIYRNIQYAPLVSSHNDKEKYDGLYTQAIISKGDKIENPTKNTYLEPQVHSNSYRNRQFVSGHNIESPKFSNNINLEYNNKALFNNAQSLHKIILPTKANNVLKSISQESSQFNNLHVLNSKKHQENPAKSIQVLSVMENAQIHPALSAYIKMPQLHLNVARSYNFARTADKAPGNEYQKIIKSNYVPIY